MTMLKPAHPGELLREDVVPALKTEKGITGVSDFAELLGCSRSYLSSVLQEKAPISVELAANLELAGLGIAHNWIAMQAAHDKANGFIRGVKTL